MPVRIITRPFFHTYGCELEIVDKNPQLTDDHVFHCHVLPFVGIESIDVVYFCIVICVGQCLDEFQ